MFADLADVDDHFDGAGLLAVPFFILTPSHLLLFCDKELRRLWMVCGRVEDLEVWDMQVRSFKLMLRLSKLFSDASERKHKK